MSSVSCLPKSNLSADAGQSICYRQSQFLLQFLVTVGVVTMFVFIKCHQASSSIIKRHQASSTIIKRHQDVDILKKDVDILKHILIFSVAIAT